MGAGLAGAGWLAISHEAVMGTYQDPSTAGTVWVPITSETLDYQSQNYYAAQIRQTTVDMEAKPNYYSIGGDISMEVDMNFLPYFLYCSRHTITKTGMMAPYTYTFVPNTAGAASTAASGAVSRTASITVVRNGVGFGYAGCIVNTQQYTIDNGVLKTTLGILGLSEADPAALGTPAWVAASLFGADAHSIYVDAAGLTPAFASADVNHNGFTADINYNGQPQNRINAARSASYISYGATEATYNTELDFLNKTEYNNFKAVTFRALKLESLKGAGAFAGASEAFQLIMYRTAYDTLPVNLSGMGDIVMAQVTGRAVGIAGGDPFKISVKTGVSIT